MVQMKHNFSYEIESIPSLSAIPYFPNLRVFCIDYGSSLAQQTTIATYVLLLDWAFRNLEP